jgi:hypothetical protein
VILDRSPYFGVRGGADEQTLHDAFAETLERHHEAFGEPPDS